MNKERRIAYFLLLVLILYFGLCFSQLVMLRQSLDAAFVAIDETKVMVERIDRALSEESKLDKTFEEAVYPFTDEEIDMIAQLVMAEADNQSEMGQRLVIDTVLNRVDHQAFPDTVYDVIYQKNQFSPVWSGRFDKCYPKEDIVNLVKEELLNRTDNEVVFFRAGDYGPYGVPLFKVGDHYFSKYA